MKKSNTILFSIFLILSLVFLGLINLYSGSYLKVISQPVISLISYFLILLIVFIFIFREYENNKVQNQFITIVTHKFRTPLTGIRWAIEMLQKDVSLLEKKDLLIEMQKANSRLMEIVDLLVGFAKFDKKLEYTLEEVRVRDLVELSFNKNSAMIKNKNLKIFFPAEDIQSAVKADRSKLQFVVDMLIDNAVKYTPANGSVSAFINTEGENLILRVVDTGIGFGFLEGKRIFKHFFRSASAKTMDTEGLGLGLYTARKIAKQHGGKLWAESAGPNNGSTFYLLLPMKK